MKKKHEGRSGKEEVRRRGKWETKENERARRRKREKWKREVVGGGNRSEVKKEAKENKRTVKHGGRRK